MSKGPRLATLAPRVQMLGGNVGVAAPSQAWQSDRRASRHVRGYGTEWDKRRLRILERDKYLCQCTACKGGDIRVRAADQVDHVVSKALWQVLHGSLDGCDDDTNLQSMHRDCHRKKTDADRAAVYAAERQGVARGPGGRG